jgi:predicted TIM-barrel fold metal-dependent hydrolase
MRIDIHTHLWPAERTQDAISSYFKARGLDVARTLSADGLIESMESDADIELSVVSALAMAEGETNDDLAPINEYVAGEIARSGGKLIGFCTVDPFGGKESAAMLIKYLDGYGFRGLKLHQNVQAFYPNDQRLYPVYEELQKRHLPVLFHTGGIGIRGLMDKYSALMPIEEIACLFPEMPIILGHAGRGMYDEVALMLRKHENVYADISANFAKLEGSEYLVLQEMIQRVKIWTGGVSKLLFGSDYPFYGQQQTLELLERCDDGETLVGELDIPTIASNNASLFVEKYGRV